jgi:formylglycine-generating enzyme required for sulfatase activity
MDWDVFISHAWEDKEDIARPLAEALRQKGLRVWYDEFTLTLGDSLRRSIDRGLAQSRYGVVILSPYFFAKEWPQKELDGLAAREVGSGKVILPVWHNVTWEDVRRFSPMLAGKLAVSTAKGLDAVVEEILRALGVGGGPPPPPPLPPKKRKITIAIATIGVIGLLIGLGAWLVPNVVDFLSVWLSGTPVAAVTPESPTDTPTVTPTSSPTHTPVTSTATPTNTPFIPTATSTFNPPPTPTPPTDTPTPIPPTPTPVPPTDTPTPSAPPDMVYVPAGEFIMGSTDAEIDSALALCYEHSRGCDTFRYPRLGNEQPQHTVYLDAFYIDKTEVTNAQYRKCVEAGACSPPHRTDRLNDYDEYNDPKLTEHPVVDVDWNQANVYCQWSGKRLPTEAEWEKAARGTDGRVYPWGNTFDGSRVNFCDKSCPDMFSDASVDDGYTYTAPVGSYTAGASPYGVLDMAGNVGEWAANSGTYKVLRGGSWNEALAGVRCAYRLSRGPDHWNRDVGFRCAKDSP